MLKILHYFEHFQCAPSKTWSLVTILKNSRKACEDASIIFRFMFDFFVQSDFSRKSCKMGCCMYYVFSIVEFYVMISCTRFFYKNHSLSFICLCKNLIHRTLHSRDFSSIKNILIMWQSNVSLKSPRKNYFPTFFVLNRFINKYNFNMI